MFLLIHVPYMLLIMAVANVNLVIMDLTQQLLVIAKNALIIQLPISMLRLLNNANIAMMNIIWKLFQQIKVPPYVLNVMLIQFINPFKLNKLLCQNVISVLLDIIWQHKVLFQLLLNALNALMVPQIRVQMIQ